MFGTYVAGVSFADDLAHVAVLQVKKRSVKLRFLGEYPRSGSAELWFLGPLLERKERMLRKVSKAGVALDHATSFTHAFPSDTSLNPADEQEQITWELANFIPAFSAGEFTRERHVLRTDAERRNADLLVVSFRTAFAGRARAALLERKIGLAKIGTNHFGAQHALLVNYPEVRKKLVALAHVTRSRTEVGLLDRGELVRYRGTATGSEGAVLEALASAMHQFSVAELYFHGGAVTPGLVKAAKSSVSCPVATLNPFRTMRIPGSLRGFESFAGKEHRFAAAAGSALEPG